MAAKFIPIGPPSNDNERQALRYLVEGLPAHYTVYGNPWLVERSGSIFELDAVVVAPHAVFIVEIKSYRGRIDGTDHDWYIPAPIASPLKLNRLTAQVLKSALKRESFAAGQVWVEGFVFLSITTDVGVQGPASRDRIHTKKTILAALQDKSLVERLSGRRSLPPTDAADKDLLRIFSIAQKGPKPIRQVREYEIIRTLGHHDTYAELLGKHNLLQNERVLRIYSQPPLATPEQRNRIEGRARWEAQVLGRLGRIEGILSADPPFSDEIGLVLPLEYFSKGITLITWLEKYGPEGQNKEKLKADLNARLRLWLKIAKVLDEAHHQGVVHRLLRPDVILVEDKPDPTQIRVTGFDLAKQIKPDMAISISKILFDATVSITSINNERLTFSAPEVVTAFSSAEPASDQFSLGAILAMLLTGKPLFEDTRQLMAAGRMMRRVRDLSQRIPLSLDEAVSRMVGLRPADRYPSLQDAIMVIQAALAPEAGMLPGMELPKNTLDPDDLQPGTRVGVDYEILPRLGQGGMAVVYAAKHLVSGRTRALKVARSESTAEDALRGEYQALSLLDHPNIVKVIDLSKIVEGRLTLIMERVSGKNLRQWLADNRTPEPATQRRLAEDLMAGLDYLEQKAITHKDLKPDNLLVSDGHLTIIDFSLAGHSEDALCGTALYRDPSSTRWTHGTDRYAAALCLFELYVGRHAFDGHVPEPHQMPLIGEEEIEPSGLAEFFRKALNPVPEQRFPSVRAMREAFLIALGEDHPAEAPTGQDIVLETDTPLRMTGLSGRAVNSLAKNRIYTVGELLALTPTQVRSIHAIGTKTASDIIGFQETLRQAGIAPSPHAEIQMEPPLVQDLMDSPEPVSKLAITASLRDDLAQANLPTVGKVAGLTHRELLAIPGIGRTRVAQVVEALHQFRRHGMGAQEEAHTLDKLWDLASRPLTEDQRIAMERSIGLCSAPESQAEIASDLNRSQPQISLDCRKGLENLDHSALAEVHGALDNALDSFGGIVRLDELGRRLEEEWTGGAVNGQGMVRLLTRQSSGRMHLVAMDGIEVIARPLFDAETLRAFMAEVSRLAGQWPPVEPDSARRTLAGLLPYFNRDPLDLGVRLCQGIRMTETGHLYTEPLDPKQSLDFVLARLRDALTLEELKREVLRVFGPETPFPEAGHLVSVLGDLDCQIQGEWVMPGRTKSLPARPAMEHDAPLLPGQERSAEAVVRDMLKEAVISRGFRMLVVPPERLEEVGRSVASVLGGTWVSFEDAFFTDHQGELRALERAERFAAQKGTLTEAAESTLFTLLEKLGQPGNIVVVGDTGILGLCDALDLPRLLYDETMSGTKGFWVLVVPGVIHNRQPHFNEASPLWHLEGVTLSLLHPLPLSPR